LLKDELVRELIYYGTNLTTVMSERRHNNRFHEFLFWNLWISNLCSQLSTRRAKEAFCSIFIRCCRRCVRWQSLCDLFKAVN